MVGLSCVSVRELVIGKKVRWSQRKAGVSCVHVAGLGIIIIEKGEGILNNPALGMVPFAVKGPGIKIS